MLNNEFLKEYPDIFPEETPLIILYIKSYICMAKNGNDTKHTIQIFRRMYFEGNAKEWTLQNSVWCEGGLYLGDIETNNVSKYELNTKLVYTMVRFEN